MASGGDSGEGYDVTSLEMDTCESYQHCFASSFSRASEAFAEVAEGISGLTSSASSLSTNVEERLDRLEDQVSDMANTLDGLQSGLSTTNERLEEIVSLMRQNVEANQSQLDVSSYAAGISTAVAAVSLVVAINFYCGCTVRRVFNYVSNCLRHDYEDLDEEIDLSDGTSIELTAQRVVESSDEYDA